MSRSCHDQASNAVGRGEVESADRVKWIYTESRMVCDRWIAARVKGSVYKMAEISAIMYNLKEMAQTKNS